jgi:hypothetical protein
MTRRASVDGMQASTRCGDESLTATIARSPQANRKRADGKLAGDGLERARPAEEQDLSEPIWVVRWVGDVPVSDVNQTPHGPDPSDGQLLAWEICCLNGVFSCGNWLFQIEKRTDPHSS